jgi:methionine-gamma-lyase
MTKRYSSPDTLAVHAGSSESEFRPVVPPIYQTSTFSFDDADQGAAIFAGREPGYIYSRMGNPTVEALERAVAELEGGHKALACASGMAAIHTAIAGLARTGDHIVCGDAVYGPTCSLIETVVLPRFGIESTFVDTTDPAKVAEAMRPNTRVVFIETPGNPTLVVSDIAAIAEVAHAHGAKLVVDNTFMSPIVQRPLEFGADLVVHSLTKFINGHADVVGGVIVARDEDTYRSLRVLLNHLGGVLPPMESFLVHRGMRTLALRMERHCANGMAVARFLEGHPSVASVHYPGLESHPQHAVAKRQMSGFGGLISFEVEGGLEAGKAVMNSVELFTLAVSLGGVESLIQHPASMTHVSMGAEARRRANIPDGLVRVSVGIEAAEDLVADLDQALVGRGEVVRVEVE